MPSEMQTANVDFSFRRGTKDGLNNTPIKNGSLNFTADTEEFYVDIDDQRLTIKDVKFYDTEAEIKLLDNPGDKLYIAKDTKRIFMYDYDISTWICIYNDSKNVFYGYCESDANSRIKVVDLGSESTFTAEDCVIVAVKFEYTNTYNATAASRIRLNVTAGSVELEADIAYGTGIPTGTNSVAFGLADAYNIYMYMNDSWVWIGCNYDLNNDYNAITSNEITEGVSTVKRVVRADYLKAGIDALIDLQIGDLNVNGATGILANQTISSWSEADGKVNITTQPISITSSQVSDLPTMGNGILTIQNNGVDVATFTANSISNVTANIEVPVGLADLDQDSTHRVVTEQQIAEWNAKGSSDLELGETSSTAYRGDRGKIAYDHSQLTAGNPHNVTKEDVGLGNVANLTIENQLPVFSTSSVRANINSGESIAIILGKIKRFLGDLQAIAFSADYTDLINTPTIGDATITIQKNGTDVDSFTVNDTEDKSINITVPTALADLTTDSTHRFVSDSEKDTWNAKQNVMSAGANIQISSSNEISATDTTYSAGTNIQIDSNNVISATDTTYSTATTASSGLLPQLDGNTSKYLKADGSWDVPAGTTYTTMSSVEAKTGTNTTSRLISAAVLSDAIKDKSWDGTRAEYNAITTKDPDTTYYIT